METITTEAAVLTEVGKPLVVEEVSLSAPGPGEVLVRLVASGVCHSDWNAVSGSSPHPLPVVLGHEGAGRVEAVGPGVSSVAPGDPVVLSWLPTCGRCAACQRGQLSLCEPATKQMAAGTLPSGARHLLRHDGSTLSHYSYLSTFARHAVVDERSCVRLHPGANLEVAALVGCAVMTGIGAVLNRARVPAGASVVVFGAGGVGLSVVMASHLVGATTIVAVDPVPTKRALAVELGATEALSGDPTELEERLAVLAPGGVDFAFEAAGLPTLVERAFRATRPGGMIVAVGVPPAGSTISLPGPELTRSERVVTGTFYGSARPHLDAPMLLALYEAGKLPLGRLVSARYPLDGVNEAFAAMHGGEVARAVLQLEEVGRGGR